MSIQKIIPKENLKNEDIRATQKKGEILQVAPGIYQVIIFKQPDRKIFTTSIDRAINILLLEDLE
ncbi:MAG: hypothetical protein K9W46_10110 [Candidatus Heimdallarchaeum endolithica]|uniref:Uncharacterized protein n=1 Tax=Candidatus Heimdallarchaeum endolithica TaxID=2876572 RepID=A0A9Y1FMI3_9ARCH|nr:MAG: hypothetical protein K9W46_10110 [Candidatus Heimdallarchaeum endolithica]